LTLGASPFLIGVDSFAMDAPVWLLTLVGGALADRGDRRRIIGGFQSVQMLCPTAIVLLLANGRLQPWMIVGLSAIVGITDALSMPSFQSIVPSIVAPDEISHGLALNSTQYNLSRILGPAIAGVLMTTVGVMACFIVSAASYVPFIGVALWILPRRSRTAASVKETASPHLLAGVGDILRDRHVGGALLTVLTTGVLCGPLMTFSSVLVRDAFHGGAGRFSATLVAFGAGGLLGAATLLGLPSTVDLQRATSRSALAIAALVMVSAVDPWFWTLIPLLALAGAFMTISNTAANSVLQASARPQRLGRTVSLYMLALRGGMSLGALFTGGTVSAFGVRPALLLNGCLALGAQTLVARFWLRSSAAGDGAGPVV
ncbi:MAG: MFS transporter, partial [Gemmatimonadaceae bacterium]